MPVSPDQLAIARGVRLRHDTARGRWVLLGPERGYVLNDTGTMLLRAMIAQELPRVMGELAAGDQERLTSMTRFLQELVDKKLIA